MAHCLCLARRKRVASATRTLFGMVRARCRKLMCLLLCCVGARPAQKCFRMECTGAQAGALSVLARHWGAERAAGMILGMKRVQCR